MKINCLPCTNMRPKFQNLPNFVKKIYIWTCICKEGYGWNYMQNVNTLGIKLDLIRIHLELVQIWPRSDREIDLALRIDIDLTSLKFIKIWLE
jgi:hypothetical protein